MVSCVCCGDLSPMTLRCPKPFGNGAEGTRSRRGTRGPRKSCPQRPRIWSDKGLARAQTCWYWGGLTVNKAKEKLEETPEGAFLIRVSSNPDYLLTISVKTSAGPTNLRIEYQDGKFRLDCIVCVQSKLKQFDSVVHLTNFYVQMCRNKRPAQKPPGLALSTCIWPNRSLQTHHQQMHPCRLGTAFTKKAKRLPGRIYIPGISVSLCLHMPQIEYLRMQLHKREPKLE